MNKTSICKTMTDLSKELSFKNLLLAKNMEQSNSKLSSCFSCALENLQREPPCVRSNAHLTISDGTTLMEFTSGNGECAITVFHNQGKVQYDVFVPNWSLYVSRLCSNPQPLSLGNLLSIRSHLHSWSSSGKNMLWPAAYLACFDLAAERYSMEPESVKKNAEMLVECDGKVMKFVSGQGSVKISVFFKQGEAKYEAQVNKYDVAMERFQTGVETLTLENLLSVKDRLRWPQWQELRSCLDEAIGRFSQEPHCVQNNAKMLIITSNEKILLLSGKGENLITVTHRFGMISYKLSERGWWEVAAKVFQKKEMESYGSL